MAAACPSLLLLAHGGQAFPSTSVVAAVSCGHFFTLLCRYEVVPQADRVLIRLEELPEKSSGGVLLPKAVVKFERDLMGEVLSLGSDVGELEAGKKAPNILQMDNVFSCMS